MYYKNMEQINSDMLEQVLSLTKGYDYNIYTENDVQKTLNKEILDIEDLADDDEGLAFLDDFLYPNQRIKR